MVSYALLHTILHLIKQCRSIDLLTGTVDGTVSKDTRSSLQLFVTIEAVVAAASHRRTSLVAVSPGIYLLFAIERLRLEDILPFLVGHTLMLLECRIRQILPDTQMSPRQRLPRRSTHHHIAHTLARWLVLRDRVDIRHMIQLSDRLRSRLRAELHHIQADRQPLNPHRVLGQFVRLLTLVPTSLLIHHVAQQRFYLLIALFVVRRFRVVPTCIHLIHFHRDRLDVPHVAQRYPLRMPRQRNLKVVGHTQLWVRHPGTLVTQGVAQTAPASPFAQRLADIRHPLP